MDSAISLSLVAAFTAGLLSFLSPCVLPLVPSYIGFLTGLTLEDLPGRRRLALAHALLFVAGFSTVFVLLGAGASSLGRTLKFHEVWLQRLGGLLLIGFGLICLGVIRIGALQQERRVHLQEKPVGYLGSLLVGMAFAAGWTPCIGPILGGILGLASAQESLGRGVTLLLAYSTGLAVPFLLAAWAMEAFLEWFQKFRRYLPWVMRASGVLLLLVGFLLLTGQFTLLAGWLQRHTPAGLLERL
jgi:cytochrome c-type biogenesis protein